MINVQFKKSGRVHTPCILLNDRQAGIDFFSPVNVEIEPNSSVVLDLLVAWQPSFRFFWESWSKKIYMQMKSRSGLAFKHRVEVTNAGVIDEDYRGNINVILYNKSNRPVYISEGDRVCQGIVYSLPKISVGAVGGFKEKKKSTSRGEKGFGSTGI